MYVCLTVDHTVRYITMTLQFPIIQNVLFHIVTHLDFYHTMSASPPALSESPIKNMTVHYNSQFCVSFPLNGAKK